MVIKCLELATKMFVILLASIVNTSKHTKCVLLSNQKCEIQPTLINKHPNGYNEEFHYYPSAVKLDRCAGNYNTLSDLSNKVWVPSKTEDINLSVFNLIIGIDQSKTITKPISYECKCKLMEQNVFQINGGITINVDVSVKNIIYVKKIIFGIL